MEIVLVGDDGDVLNIIDGKAAQPPAAIVVTLEPRDDRIYLLGYALQDKMANTPRDYKERMVVEWKELQVRIMNLDAFFTTDLFKSLPEEKKTLMERQHKVMVEYRQILAERMKLEDVPL